MEYVYAVLLLHKLGKQVTETSLKKVIEATGTEIDESKLKSLVASLKGVDIDKELESATLAVSATHVVGAVEVKAEEKKEEVKAEAAAEGLSALFG